MPIDDDLKVPSQEDRPKWLELGAAVRYCGIERRISGIRPGKSGGWELMPASIAKWVDASKVEFVAPPDPSYRPVAWVYVQLVLGKIKMAVMAEPENHPCVHAAAKAICQARCALHDRDPGCQEAGRCGTNWTMLLPAVVAVMQSAAGRTSGLLVTTDFRGRELRSNRSPA